MNTLSLQTSFQQHVLGHADATALLVGEHERRQLGLAIYANAYRRRLVDALADAYAKTHALLGDEAFDDAALDHIAAHPPTTRSLRWFGSEFPDHLARTLPARTEIAELARLDWALRSAFDGPDSAVLSAAELSALPPEAWTTLSLKLVPTAALLHFEHNTVAQWQALNDGLAAPATERASVGVDWLVWRKELQPHFRSLSVLEAGLLRALLAGQSFAQACEQACEQATDDTADDDPARIGTCLRQWLEDDLLSAIA